MHVAILDDIHHAYESTEGVRRLRQCVSVDIFTGPFGGPDALAPYDAVVANRERTRFSHELLQRLPNLRIIAQTGNHAYHIDLGAAARLGIVVAKASGGFSTGTAELAIGLMISLMRRLPQCDAAVKSGDWRTPLTPVLHGKTLGIVGLGHVGRHVASIARAFEMRVLAWSPRLTDESSTALGVERAELDDLLRRADVVSVHATLAPESRGLIDARRLALLKPTAYLINTSRGPIVEERALADALADGKIAGAGLDVFDREPLPAGHPLTRLPNVMLTPHIGWPTDEAYERFADAAADVLLAFRDGMDVPRFHHEHA